MATGTPTAAQWFEGARPRTLPAAVAPVLAGTGVAAWTGDEVWWKASLALVVSLLLQVGVNYANDYSDGVRGTDDARVGPLRLVGSGLATPAAVKRAAFVCFGLAAATGLVLAASTTWWLVAVGALSILAAWYYTGGSKPYGYLGLGEVMVFVFFGLVAVLGTWYVQAHDDHGLVNAELSRSSVGPALYAAIGVGALACAILVANNLRDIPTDVEAGKRTLAVRLGAGGTRAFYAALVATALVALVAVALATDALALLGLVGFVGLLPALRTVIAGAVGKDLIPVLQQTGLGELLYATGIFAGLLLAR
ncbi:MAG TPA: 1,4-dihydroxy-2-naphthoate polyprenyltransferase [Marmoricola sp.]